MRLWRRTPDPNPHRPWWVKYTPDTREPIPYWRPPKGHDGHIRLRKGLSELFACGAYKEFRKELGVSKEAIARFMAGDRKAFTSEQMAHLIRYLGGFGHDMSSGKFVRLPRPGDPPGPRRPQTPPRVREPHETESWEERRRRVLSLINPIWR